MTYMRHECKIERASQNMAKSIINKMHKEEEADQYTDWVMLLGFVINHLNFLERARKSGKEWAVTHGSEPM